MMKRKTKTRRAHKKAKKSSARKSKATKMTMPRTQLIDDDRPLTATEIARVKESRQNIKEGKYVEFTSVDDMWKFAESD